MSTDQPPCRPISVGGKHEFAKPGIDSYQQGFVFANGDRNPGCEQPGGGPKLPYSPVGIELRPGRLRVKEDSRANYADIVEIDHDAQVMVVGDVAMYFDRVRRNVNRAFMRQILRKALDEYRQNNKNPSAGTGNPIPIIPEDAPASSSAGAPPVPVSVSSAASRSVSTITPANHAASVLQAGSSIDRRSTSSPTHERSDSEPEMMTFDQQLELLHYLQRHNAQQQQERQQMQQMQQQQQSSSSSRPPSRAMSTISTTERSRERPDSRRTSRSYHSSHPRSSSHRRRHSSQNSIYHSKVVESRPMRGVTGPGAGPPPVPGESGSSSNGYDGKSMHNVAMAGLK